jgi:DnaJ-class molecular chaperone
MSLPPTQAAPQVDPQLVNKLKALWKNLPQLSYYQLLEVAPSADATAIKKAFYRISREYHPDRYFRFPHENFRNAVNTMYKRISEAYNILREPDMRKAYDLQLAADPTQVRFSIEDELKRRKQGGTTYDGGQGPGRKYWQASMDALRNKNLLGAKLQMQLAVGMEPTNEHFKAKLEDFKSGKVINES